jgi:hypothetical protein
MKLMKSTIEILEQIKPENMEAQISKLKEVDYKVQLNALCAVKQPELKIIKATKLAIKPSYDNSLKPSNVEAVTIHQSNKKSYVNLNRWTVNRIFIKGQNKFFSFLNKNTGRVTTRVSYKSWKEPSQVFVNFNQYEFNDDKYEEQYERKNQPSFILRMPYIAESQWKTRTKIIRRKRKTLKTHTIIRNWKIILNENNNLEHESTEKWKNKFNFIQHLRQLIKEERKQRKLIIERYNDVVLKQKMKTIKTKEKQIKKNETRIQRYFNNLEAKKQRVQQKLDRQYDILNSKKARLQDNYERYHSKLDQYYKAVDNLRQKKKEFNPYAKEEEDAKALSPEYSGEGNQTNGKPEYSDLGSEYDYD